MTVHQLASVFDERVRVAAIRRNRGERTFDLHPAIHAMVVGSYFSFVGILAAGFMGSDLMLPTAIFLVGVAALFVTPGLWARIRPDDGLPKQTWGEFRQEGVDCLTGELTADQAMAQILVLPGFMICLALVFGVIKVTL